MIIMCGPRLRGRLWQSDLRQPNPKITLGPNSTPSHGTAHRRGGVEKLGKLYFFKYIPLGPCFILIRAMIIAPPQFLIIFILERRPSRVLLLIADDHDHDDDDDGPWTSLITVSVYGWWHRRRLDDYWLNDWTGSAVTLEAESKVISTSCSVGSELIKK